MKPRKMGEQNILFAERRRNEYSMFIGKPQV
jgi:hypothetical protein